MAGLNEQETPAKGEKPSKRCGECGFRIRTERHEEGAHHSRGQIGYDGKAAIMSQGRAGRKTDIRTLAKKAHRGYDFSATKTGGRR